jgi:hypothetical protein
MFCVFKEEIISVYYIKSDFILVSNVCLLRFCRAIQPHTAPHPYAYIYKTRSCLSKQIFIFGKAGSIVVFLFLAT